MDFFVPVVQIPEAKQRETAPSEGRRSGDKLFRFSGDVFFDDKEYSHRRRREEKRRLSFIPITGRRFPSVQQLLIAGTEGEPACTSRCVREAMLRRAWFFFLRNSRSTLDDNMWSWFGMDCLLIKVSKWKNICKTKKGGFRSRGFPDTLLISILWSLYGEISKTMNLPISLPTIWMR